MEFFDSMFISASGMRAQGQRLRVIAENIANAESVGETPGQDPYRRKVIAFKNYLDRGLQADVVKVSKVGTDPSEFRRRYEPGHPAADDQGYVSYPNVNSLVEMTDMREAQRSYEANLKVIETSRAMLSRAIDILR
ncbi:flagellar basal-body rod protein FlgC [Dongia mobilis]|uniref:Flagellar basal-body rod protein FlgC n=1 Tax=Dongia mobilis TaxID=578943 RepID=A0A4R6WVD3_9PROT|nr:flagellar basal body rod protein FlgC [Dongia mobilis]TDQ84399.1 flagellar basal-body rod protein FlgC [Dongia mobilis]